MGEIVIMNDLEWPNLSYYAIYYERFRKVMQQTEKVALMYLVKVFYKQYTHLPVKHAYSMIDFHQPHNQDNILPCTIPDECHPP